MQMLFIPYIFLNRYEKETCILDPYKLYNEFSNLKLFSDFQSLYDRLQDK